MSKPLEQLKERLGKITDLERISRILSDPDLGESRRGRSRSRRPDRGRGFGALRDWLGEHVHAHGRKFSPQETLERATGNRIDAKPYLAYLRAKYGAGVAA